MIERNQAGSSVLHFILARHNHSETEWSTTTTSNRKHASNRQKEPEEEEENEADVSADIYEEIEVLFHFQCFAGNEFTVHPSCKTSSKLRGFR